MKSLQDILTLPRAGLYLSPRRASQTLPLVYGDLTCDSQGPGTWTAVCIDTEAHVYALAGTPLLPIEQGNQARVFDRQGNEIFDFTFNPSHDYLGRGAIATMTMAQDQRAQEPLSVSAKGRAGQDGGLLTNPVDILRDFLLDLAGLEPWQLDGATWAKAHRHAAQQGHQAAGVIGSDQALGSTLSQILGCFLGSWWLDAAGSVRIALQGGLPLVMDDEVAFSFAACDTLEAQASADIKNTCNRIACQYAYNWDSQAYQSHDDGQDSQDLLSRALYDDQYRQLKLPWVRLAQVASRVQELAVRRFAQGVRLISLDLPGLPALHLEKGDYAWFSSTWLRDLRGRALNQQLVRVLGLETDLDARSTSLTLEDTGLRKTLASLADGSALADGAMLAGGQEA